MSDIPSKPNDTSAPDARIAPLLDAYFDRRATDPNLTPQRFAAEHPEFGPELEPYLAGLELIERARARVSGAVATAAVPPPEIPGFELMGEIGRGGMGVVYRARQLSTRREVALKLMLAGSLASPAARRRFQREVQLAARLRHPAIVTVLEGGEAAGQAWYAMEYVAGTPLDQHIAAVRPDARRRLAWFVEICAGVEFAHSHQIVHRDLKPANVLMDADSHPHLLDFGLAKALDQGEDSAATAVSLPGQVLGTIQYLSPEQAAGAESDIRTDVYALGVMLFEALTGQLPTETSGRPSEVLRRIREVPPRRPTALSPNVNAELEAILLKALEKDPAARYASAGELGDDLSQYLAGAPVSARRPSRLHLLRRRLRRHRLAVAAVTLLLLVGAGALAGAFWTECQAHRAGRQLALQYIRTLEAGTGPPEVLGSAQALYERHPRLPDAALAYAQAQYRCGQQFGTIRFLQTAIADGRADWAVHALLAEIHAATGDPTEAAVHARLSDAQTPDTAEGWYLRSLATLERHSACALAERSVQRSPDFMLGWQRLAWLRLQTEDLEGARHAADRLIALGANRAYWTVFRGNLRARQGRFLAALDDYAAVLAPGPQHAGPEYWSALLGRANTNRRLKRYEAALADYTTLLDRQPGDDLWDLYQRATPLWILNRTEEALADYHRVRTLLGRPFYGDARAFLILHELRRPVEAAELLASARAATVDPWLQQIFRCLAGEYSPDELVTEATRRGNREQLCEACYYGGEACLLAGRTADACEYFRQCLATGLAYDPDTALGTPMNEYELAEWRLDRLCSTLPASQPAP